MDSGSDHCTKDSDTEDGADFRQVSERGSLLCDEGDTLFINRIGEEPEYQPESEVDSQSKEHTDKASLLCLVTCDGTCYSRQQDPDDGITKAGQRTHEGSTDFECCLSSSRDLCGLNSQVGHENELSEPRMCIEELEVASVLLCEDIIITVDLLHCRMHGPDPRSGLHGFIVEACLTG